MSAPVRDFGGSVEESLRRADSVDPRIWMSRPDPDDLRAALRGAVGPLAGRLLAVKDNVDVAGMVTTAGCRAFGYRADATAPSVARLTSAGAVVVGKTTMDMFATGLTGTRGPDGPIGCALAPEVIAGGSSSGSAVAVALGCADIGVATDTAGSGRVPAALNGIVGVKPTRGIVSTVGVVPACRSLDCVAFFGRTVAEATEALAHAAYGGRAAPSEDVAIGRRALGPTIVGVPAPSVVSDPVARELFEAACARCAAAGMDVVEVDIGVLEEAGRLLYEGPWVAERTAAVGEFIAAHPNDVDPVVREVILAGEQVSGRDVFAGAARLADLVSRCAPLWEQVDAVLVPTAEVAPTIAQVAADPHGWQRRLGRFTNFVNLMDLCAISVPSGRWDSGAGFGVQFVAPAFADVRLAALAGRFEASASPVRVCVVGAHLRGQPLNRQLTARGARFVEQTRTAPWYRLFALADTVPPKPGLVRVDVGGAPIEVEVWELSIAAFGSFVAEIPAPLGIGSVQLEDGSWVNGFICEPAGLAGATDITALGGWRAHVGAHPA